MARNTQRLLVALTVIVIAAPASAQSAVGGPHKQTNFVGGAVVTPNPVVPVPRGASSLPSTPGKPPSTIVKHR
jgi:hypothetical protein